MLARGRHQEVVARAQDGGGAGDEDLAGPQDQGHPGARGQPELGHLATASAPPSKHLVELRVEDVSQFEVGQLVSADVFAKGDRVDVTGVSKGKGFSGVMKRHNFKGVSASHGAHRNHRKPGSIGASSTPSRVFKGMRMAGRMGGERVTVLNLTVHAVDAEKGLMLVKGAVPGARGRIVYVRNAVKGA